MKIIIASIGLFLFSSNFGQDSRKLNYQIDVGTNFTVPYKKVIATLPDWFPNNPVTKYSTQTAYFIDFIIIYKHNNRFLFNSGLNYYESKLSINRTMGIAEDKGYIAKSHIYLPISFQYKIFNNLPLYFGLGVYFGALVNAKEYGKSYLQLSKLDSEGSLSLRDTTINYNINIKDSHKNFDFGILTQLDYNIPINENFSAIIFSKFNNGLITVFKNADTYTWKNYNLMFGFGIRL